MSPSCKQAQSVRDKIIADLEAAPEYRECDFSEFEDGLIRKYYPTKGATPIAKAIGKDRKQVVHRACQLGVRLLYGKARAK